MGEVTAMTARVLVVEDNRVNLKLITYVLEEAGYEVLQATDAAEALAIVRATKPDLILTDISLPGMDGLTLARILRANEQTREVCIVAVSALGSRADRQRASEAGCDAYVTKPIDTRTLPARISELLLPRRGKDGSPDPERTAGAVATVPAEKAHRSLLGGPRSDGSDH
jgi:two-component system, cell cycle response regulator DivK